MTKAYAVGSKVSWSWGQGEARGEVAEVFKARVQRTIKGSKITRRASETNPAYLVEQADGGKALKSHSELEKASRPGSTTGEAEPTSGFRPGFAA